MQYLANIKLFEVLGAQKPSKMMHGGAVFNADAIYRNVKIINDLGPSFSVTGADYTSLDKADDQVASSSITVGGVSTNPQSLVRRKQKKQKSRNSRNLVTQALLAQILQKLESNDNKQETPAVMPARAEPSFTFPKSPIRQWIKGFNFMASKQTREYFDHIWKVRYGARANTSEAWDAQYTNVNRMWKNTVGKAAKEFVHTFEEFWKFVQDTYQNAYSRKNTST